MPYFILGDDAFPHRTWLMKTFPGKHLHQQEKIFNYRLSRGKGVTVNTFGILANRFQCLLSTLRQQPETVSCTILACILLHNYMRLHNPAAQNRMLDSQQPNGHVIPGGVVAGSPVVVVAVSDAVLVLWLLLGGCHVRQRNLLRHWCHGFLWILLLLWCQRLLLLLLVLLLLLPYFLKLIHVVHQRERVSHELAEQPIMDMRYHICHPGTPRCLRWLSWSCHLACQCRQSACQCLLRLPRVVQPLSWVVVWRPWAWIYWDSPLICKHNVEIMLETKYSWCHSMETLNALLFPCEGNLSVTGWFPWQRDSNSGFDAFFDVKQKKLLNKQSRCWWFKKPWRSCAVTVMMKWFGKRGLIWPGHFQIPNPIQSMYFNVSSMS